MFQELKLLTVKSGDPITFMRLINEVHDKALFYYYVIISQRFVEPKLNISTFIYLLETDDVRYKKDRNKRRRVNFISKPF